MKIATWNIGEDETNQNNILNLSSYQYIVNTIQQENIDIICLQEAITKSDTLPSIASYIKENTDLKYNVEFELSDSHINIGCKMGVVICSKDKIDSYELLMLDNPKLVYKKEIYSHDKGFIIAKIKDLCIITGHCLPFHVFNKNTLDYIDIFKKAENKFFDIYKTNKKIILCGDFNYENIKDLFPKFMQISTDLINSPTRKNKQLDHFCITNNLKSEEKKIIENNFDHKLSIFGIIKGSAL